MRPRTAGEMILRCCFFSWPVLLEHMVAPAIVILCSSPVRHLNQTGGAREDT